MLRYSINNHGTRSCPSLFEIFVHLHILRRRIIKQNFCYCILNGTTLVSNTQNHHTNSAKDRNLKKKSHKIELGDYSLQQINQTYT
jgi:hypothetical protein